MQTKNRGFTLLEILIVIALIALIATIILPALRRTDQSAMRNAIQNIANQVSLAYENALFTGQMHRMVFDVQQGRFWTEIAPKEFKGRAPVFSEEQEAKNRLKESLYNRFNDEARNAASLKIPLLEIPAHQKNALKDVPWQILQTNLIEPQALLGDVIFVKISTALSSEPIKFPIGVIQPPPTSEYKPDPKYTAYIYFFPSATTTPVSIQVGFIKNGIVDVNAPKYTLNLNILTGKLKLSEGFLEANFELPK